MAGTTRWRTAAKLRTILAVIVIAVAGTAAPGEPAWAAHVDSFAQKGSTICAPAANGTGTKCTNTFSNDTGWDVQLGGGPNVAPWGAQTGLAPTVTVDQTSNLTNQIVNVSWTNFTPSFTSNLTDGLFSVPGQTAYGVAVFQCKGETPQALSSDQCNVNFADTSTSTAGATPTAVEAFTQGGNSASNSADYGDCTQDPGDAVCGTGSTSIQVQTYIQNSELGCGKPDPKSGVGAACSIVVVPLWGGDGPNGNCADHSSDYTAEPSFNLGTNAMDTLTGFFNTCAWRDRIVVPITFAPTPSQFCSTNYQFTAAGSPTLERVMQQWQPAWCTAQQNKVTFNYNSGVNEYEARTTFLHGNGSLSAGTDVALVTDPPSASQTAGSTRRFTYAPIADTGIVIAYYVDNVATQQPITDLVLNARLVAKLLTQSYSLSFNHCKPGQTAQNGLCDPAVAGNPRDIFQDPEFLALNPNYNRFDFDFVDAANTGGFLPIVAEGNSDLTYELTRWVESDPDARSFLQGMADPWGMHVNRYYETSQTYPITQFQAVDPGFTLPASQLNQLGNPDVGNDNVTMQVSWTPVNGLDSVAAHLASWTSTAEQFSPLCNDVQPVSPPCRPGIGIFNPKDAPQIYPNRALFAVMDQGTAAAFRFPAALLKNPAGNAEGPTLQAETAALDSMQTNPDKITRFQDFTKTSPNAYPLTEVQYAMVPTCGLTAAKTQAISAFLQNVSSSQLYGNQVGQIPPFGGYWALNDAQKAQTATAAQQVSSQACTTVPPDHTVSGQNPPPSSGTSPPSSGSGGNPGGGIVPSPGGHSITSSGTPKASSSPTSPQQIKAIDLGQKSSDDAGLAHYLLPAILILGAVLLLGGPLTYAFSTGALRMPPVRRLWPVGGSRPPAGSPDPSAGGSEGLDD